MKTELSASADKLLERIGQSQGTIYMPQTEQGLFELIRLGLIYRPESGFARITEVGQELLAKLGKEQR